MSTIIFLSYIPIFIVFMVFVFFRLDFFATLSVAALLLWIITVPFFVIFLEERKGEKH